MLKSSELEAAGMSGALPASTLPLLGSWGNGTNSEARAPPGTLPCARSRVMALLPYTHKHTHTHKAVHTTLCCTQELLCVVTPPFIACAARCAFVGCGPAEGQDVGVAQILGARWLEQHRQPRCTWHCLALFPGCRRPGHAKCKNNLGVAGWAVVKRAKCATHS